MSCENCPFKNLPSIKAVGNIESPFVIIGEAPAPSDLLFGRPMVGSVGDLLRKALKESGLHYPKPYITTALQCKPHDAITWDTIKTCRTRLVEEIEKHPRKLIITLGKVALQAITNDRGIKITQVRGTRLQTVYGTVFPILHPAAILRNPTDEPMFMNDVKVALTLLNDIYEEPDNTVSYEVIESLDRAVEVVDDLLKNAKEASCDIETTGLNYLKDDLLSIAVSYGEDHTYIFTPGTWWPLINILDSSDAPEWIYHNGKFDTKFFRRFGVEAPIDHDTMIEHYLLDETLGSHGLKSLAMNFLNVPDYGSIIQETLKQLEKKFRKDEKDRVPNYGDIDPSILYHYQAKDALYTYKLHRIFIERIRKDKGLDYVYRKIMIPGLQFLRNIEETGIQMDREFLEYLEKEMEPELERVRQVILNAVKPYWNVVDFRKWKASKTGKDSAYKKVDEVMKKIDKYQDNEKYVEKLDALVTFKPSSWEHLSYVLYEVMKLEPQQKGLEKTTEEKVLQHFIESDAVIEKYGPHHVELLENLLLHRAQSKVLSTYVRGNLLRLDEKNRIHSTFNMTVARTGRLSSTDPNLQNVIKDSVVRKAFIPGRNKVFIEIDLSQAELRALAFFSNDEFLRNSFINDLDLHSAMAESIFGPEYTSTQRGIAKTINFGIVYGLTEFGLIARYPYISVKDAQKYFSSWYDRCPGAFEYLTAERNKGIQKGFVRSRWGRIRRFHYGLEDALTDPRLRKHISNEAANFGIQSWTSDVMLVGAMETYESVRDLGANMLNLVHDSVLIECPSNENTIHEVIRIVTESVTNIPSKYFNCDVPFKADSSLGKTWYKPDRIDYDYPRSDKSDQTVSSFIR